MQIPNSGRPVAFYGLDVIIAVGYCGKSPRGMQFRIWATERLREYITKGFTMNDDLLKQAGGGNYWRELLEKNWRRLTEWCPRFLAWRNYTQ